MGNWSSVVHWLKLFFWIAVIILSKQCRIDPVHLGTWLVPIPSWVILLTRYLLKKADEINSTSVQSSISVYYFDFGSVPLIPCIHNWFLFVKEKCANLKSSISHAELRIILSANVRYYTKANNLESLRKYFQQSICFPLEYLCQQNCFLE